MTQYPDESKRPMPLVLPFRVGTPAAEVTRATAALFATPVYPYYTSKSRVQPLYFSPQRAPYTVTIDVEGEREPVVFEMHMSHPEAVEAYRMIEGCWKVRDWRYRLFKGKARFDKGNGPLVRYIQSLRKG